MKHPLRLSRRKSPMALPLPIVNHHRKQRGKWKYLSKRFKMLRSEMEEISEEQKEIKEGQRQVREKFQAVELECEQLRKETSLVIHQSFNTQIRLAFMFQILKARENHEFDKAAKLTAALRQLIATENQKMQIMAPVPDTCSNK